MLSQLRSRLTYANIVSSMCLFLLLGGSAYAATKLPKNSVTSKALKKGAVHNSDLGRNSVTTSKVKNRSLRATDFKKGQLPKGATGSRGATGSAGRSALTALTAGEMVHGVVGFAFTATAATQRGTSYQTFPVPTTTPVTSADVDVDTVTAGEQCTGTYAAPTAPAGKVCIYLVSKTNVKNLQGFAPFGTATKFGFAFLADSVAAGATVAQGSWAYTAG